MAASSDEESESCLNLILLRKVLNVELELVVLPERRKLPIIGLCRGLGDEGVGEDVVDLRCCGEYDQLGLDDAGRGENGFESSSGPEATAEILSEFRLLLVLKIKRIF